MDKDRIEGEAKDVSGRVQRQVGEWTGNSESQVKGAAKQVEGKAQKAVGQAKDNLREAEEKDEKRREDSDLDRKAS